MEDKYNMKKAIMEKYEFREPVCFAFKIAQNIAVQLQSEKVYSWHIFVALAYLYPEIVRELLETSVSSFLNSPLIDWDEADTAVHELDFADEVKALLLDTSEDTPLYFIFNGLSCGALGPAELAFVILKEPSREVVEIIAQYNGTNDFDKFSEMLCRNYLKIHDKYSGVSSREHLKNAVEKGKKIADFVNQRLIGQESAVDLVTNSLVNFWHKGNQLQPLSILLVAKSGAGKSYFARTLQEGFMVSGLQETAIPPLDMSCFTSEGSTDNELLGNDQSYQCAHYGKLYELTHKNRTGMLIFENVHLGCRNAKRILCSFAQNNAYDKFYKKNLFLPSNVLIFTMTIPERYYYFLKENKDVDFSNSRQLNEILRDCPFLSQEDIALVNTVQEIVCLEDLSEHDLSGMVQNRLCDIEKRMQQDYQLAFECPDKDKLIGLFLQSAPHELTPKDLCLTMDRYFNILCKELIKHPEVEKIEIRCEDLPNYPHDPARRTIRGDYLTFRTKNTHEKNVFSYVFCDIKYACQENIECGAYRIARPKNLKLDDIVGLDDLKNDLCDALDYISGKYEKYNVPPPALGYILHGEPGTGKTATICALANSCDLPVFFANSSVFADAEKIDDLFSKAKRMAPAIVVLEELNNAIGYSADPRCVAAITTLLTHMDGLEETSKLLVLGSTNYIDRIESALRRPGRFTRIVHVLPPKAESREQYIRKFEKQYAFELSDEDRQFFVALTQGRTIAVMKGVLEYALRTSVRHGEEVNAANLENAYKCIVGNENGKKQKYIGFNGAE